MESLSEQLSDVILREQTDFDLTETMKEVALKVGIIENTTEIRDVSTSIMIARGCLAVNVGAENLLKAQDDIVDKCIQTKEKLYIASNI